MFYYEKKTYANHSDINLFIEFNQNEIIVCQNDVIQTRIAGHENNAQGFEEVTKIIELRKNISEVLVNKGFQYIENAQEFIKKNKININTITLSDNHFFNKDLNLKVYFGVTKLKIDTSKPTAGHTILLSIEYNDAGLVKLNDFFKTLPHKDFKLDTIAEEQNSRGSI